MRGNVTSTTLSSDLYFSLWESIQFYQFKYYDDIFNMQLAADYHSSASAVSLRCGGRYSAGSDIMIRTSEFS